MSMLGCNSMAKREEEEPNPQTLHLNKLVKLIEPKVLSYYLEQVYVYLQNQKRDLWFPLISPNLEAFLIRIIQSSQNFKIILDLLDEKNRKLATDIIDTLEANRNVYTVVHMFETSNHKNTLIYRKVSKAKSSESAAGDEFSRMCSVNNPTVPEEKTVPKKPKLPKKRDVITVPFKLQWIQTALKFVKNTNEDILDLPEMDIEQAEYVYSLIREKESDDPDPNIRSHCVPLKEALSDFNEANEMKATFIYTTPKRVQLSFVKSSSNNNTEEEPKPEPVQKTLSPFELERLTNAQRNMARKTALIKTLEPSFIRTALQMIYDFMTEDAEAVIVFQNANFEQCFFLQSILSMVKVRKLHDMFSDESKSLLRKISNLLSPQQNFDLKIAVGKMDTTSKLRQVSLSKSPTEKQDPTEPRRRSNPSQNASSHTNSTQVKNKPIVAPTSQPLNKIPTDKNPSEQKTITSPITETADRSTNTDTVDAKTIDKSKTTNKLSKTVNGEKQAIDNQNQTKRGLGVGTGLGLRKTRLIEGLSTPLESHVAMRMMRQMGWAGGPLGARGDGLAEPVMPAIHLKAGAGLGHVEPKKEPKPKPPKIDPNKPPKIDPKKPPKVHLNIPPKIDPSQTSMIDTNTPPIPDKPYKPKPILSRTVHCHKPTDIRLDILKHILSTITERPVERVVIYSTKLAKKEIKFLENTMQEIIKRGALDLNKRELQDIYERIKGEMMSKPELQLGCLISGDLSTVTLSKYDIPQKLKTFHQITQPNQMLIDRVFSLASEYTLSDLITPDMTAILGKQLMPNSTTKSVKSLGHKVILITTVFQLINSEDTERIIKFDYPMTCKKVSYINEMLLGLNKRRQWSHSSIFENYVSKEMLALVKGDMYMSALFGKNNQHITFQKTLSKSRITKHLEKELYTHDQKNNSASVAKVNDKENAKVNEKDNPKRDSKTVNDSKDLTVELVKNKSDLKDDKKTKKIKIEEVTDTKENYNKISCKELAKNANDSSETNIKYLGIAPKAYPLVEIGIDVIIAFQNNLCKILDDCKDKPLLECLGIKNGTLVYCCHNTIGASFIKRVANEMRLDTLNLTVLFKKNEIIYRMKADYTTFTDIDFKILFTVVEKYNVGLKTDMWTVEDVQYNNGVATITLKIDKNSLDYISEHEFKIFAGMDSLKFNMAWDE